jgi:colanic acid biosynthesis glycosyl transferase WcaI
VLSSRPHILIISQIYPPDLGGSATRALNVAKGLIANGARVTVVAAFPHYPEGKIPKRYKWKPLVQDQEGQVRIIRTFVPGLESKGMMRRLVLFLSFIISSLFALPLVRDIDGVFASNPQVLSAFPAKVYSKVSSSPLILNVDDLWPESLYDLGMLRSGLGQGAAESVARLAYSLADRIAPISAGYGSILRSKYGIPPARIATVPGGVDLDLFPWTNTSTRKDGEFVVLYLGAFSPAYDFRQVLKAAKLLEDDVGVRIVLQGAGEMLPKVEKDTRVLGLTNVTIKGYVIPRPQAARLMLTSDALLLPLSGLPNIELGFSSKIYEYQAAGKPIICCSNGNAAKYVETTGSGMKIRPGDFVALAEAVRFLRQNPSIADMMGRAGRSIVERNYSIESVGHNILELLEGCGNVLDGRGS